MIPKILQQIMMRTITSKETPSESFALCRQDLLLSEDWSRVVVPVFNVLTITDIIQLVSLCHYIKTKHNSMIIIVIDPRCELTNIAKLFPGAYDRLIECKRYIQLEDICEKTNITKLVYHKCYDLYIDYNDIVKPLSIDCTVLAENPAIKAPKQQPLHILSGPTEVLPEIPGSNKNSMHIINHNNLLEYNLYLVSGCQVYIYARTNKELDYLVPFLGIKIVQSQSRLYDNPLFAFSETVINGQLMSI